jgi:hypothetical protein
MMPEAPDIPRGTFRFAGPKVSPRQNCLDSPALSSAEQAKSVRRPVPTFTLHAQLFHKNQNCASAQRNPRNWRGIHVMEIWFRVYCTEIVQPGLRKSQEKF